MTYPNTFLTRRLRRAIMIGLIAIFSISAPMLIFYTIGYRIDFRTFHVQQTGVVSITIRPADANIFINALPVSSKKIGIFSGETSARITNLKPGAYRIRIEKEGYYPWEKEMPVESTQTTYIRDLSLMKKASPVRLNFFSATTTPEHVVFSHDGQYAMAQQQTETGITVDLIDFSKRPPKRIPVSTTAGTAPFSLSWSWSGHYGLIGEMEKDIVSSTIFSAKNPAITATVTTTKSAHVSQWPKQKTEQGVYIQKEDMIQRINTLSEKNIAISSSSIWYVDDHQTVFSYAPEKNVLERSPKNQSAIYLEEEIDQIIDINDNRLIAHGPAGVMIFSRSNGIDIQGKKTVAVDSWYYNPFVSEWVLWSPWELWNIYENGSLALFNRTSEPMKDVKALDIHGALFIAKENALIAFHPDYHMSQTVLSDVRIESFGVDVKKRIIYFFGEVNKEQGIFELAY
ncbi:MAG TPA: hypothetical protein DCY48_00045 [Candidatus Magasanikbacteria bacterium]|nr:MAG: hypothetical protein A3I74_04925 [Candidatus Magasanikbacteria bacterium RIFCSPLOWO2_02_FULL_47_16]OGH79756.1 MAG: hypothetical protein A3C10_04075 [Candidatus Magasanikbacteria bacterium RIFCSPHIGHO2_02_FULL_48_18]OGH82542.1 MAG: hypothetical protein A3G08_03755 [Candidatus Magasanikbacteria bacterium RIFCSPLOWO2_12_FULL_47_9b]HAZ28158.1 hypothetical protein [Candidatus Magasanikbacteria bacterium]